MNSMELPVVYPLFQNLKRSGRFFHFTAASLIVAHALSHFIQHQTGGIYFWCQLLIAADIIILVSAGRQLLEQMPRLNTVFRIIEVIFFAGIGLILFFEGNWMLSGFHVTLAFLYGYLAFCELKINREEFVGIYYSGISIPSLPEARFFYWTNISRIHTSYDSITILTSDSRTFHFMLRNNLQFSELEQINEFCRHYLGSEI